MIKGTSTITGNQNNNNNGNTNGGNFVGALIGINELDPEVTD